MRSRSAMAIATLVAAIGQSPLVSTPASAASVLIRGATIHTEGPAGVIAGDLLITDGRIAAIGGNLNVPQGAEIIDAAGRAASVKVFVE